ncbi:KGK domain-containing protein [Thermostichus vulcanus]|uniref:Uncharacterized protein n=1 Tax=Thermostichus vulcanus str. 'Rupite' TaxID=2813851 RepID=A0ABT0C8Z1_THEVL|nr:KGK domain-containing protein [Thermostichus vulcanus]MCJ2541810.1 hypothetical protein [Thermostichus vulcanus str. 'Rupite']
MPSKPIELQQFPEGILSIGEKTFKIANLLKAAQDDLVKEDELNRLFIAALRATGILSPDDLINIASSFFAPKPEETLLQEAKWFEQGLACQLLIPGKKEWEKDKVRLRISVQFEPEAVGTSASSSGSPLDDIRKDSE